MSTYLLYFNVWPSNLPPASGLGQATAANSVKLAGAGVSNLGANRTNIGYFNSGDMYYSLTLNVATLGNANSTNGAFFAGFNCLTTSTTDSIGSGGARLLM